MKKFRPETTLERIQRMHHIYDNGPKPKHFDDPKVIDQENLGKKPKPLGVKPEAEVNVNLRKSE